MLFSVLLSIQLLLFQQYVSNGCRFFLSLRVISQNKGKLMLLPHKQANKKEAGTDTKNYLHKVKSDKFILTI